MEANEKKTPTLIRPDYASPERLDVSDNQKSFTRAAAACGAIPLSIGMLIFLLWLSTRAHFLVWGGLLAVCFGLFCFSIGIWLLLAHASTIDGPRRLSRFLSTSWLALLLLFINFPVALGIIWLVARMM
jgi:hypothetical protein